MTVCDTTLCPTDNSVFPLARFIMCGLAILTAVVLLPLAGLGFIFVEQECKEVLNQRRQFNLQIEEMEAIMDRVRNNYDSH